jgi:hypothetical protein
LNKTCSKCKQALPSTDEYFFNRKDAKDGLSSACKQCSGRQYGKRRTAEVVIEEIEINLQKDVETVLYEDYVVNELSLKDIGKKYNTDKNTVRSMLQKVKIKLRTKEESDNTKSRRSKISAGLTRENHFRWNGGRTLLNNGYVMLRIKEPHPFKNNRSCILEHRYVPEKFLKENDSSNPHLIEVYEWDGKWLDPEIHVHHINQIRNDNRLENLVSLTPLEHMQLHNESACLEYSPEELELKLVEFLKNNKDTTYKNFNKIYGIQMWLFKKWFGSWSVTKEYIITKYELERIFIKKGIYSDEDLLNNMKMVVEKLGRLPQTRDMKTLGISPHPYSRKFGTFKTALDYYIANDLIQI